MRACIKTSQIFTKGTPCKSFKNGIEVFSKPSITLLPSKQRYHTTLLDSAVGIGAPFRGGATISQHHTQQPTSSPTDVSCGHANRKVLFTRELNNHKHSSTNGGRHYYDVERLLSEGVLYFNETSTHPKCCVFLLDPQNQRLKQHVEEQKSTKSMDSWFEREISSIVASKEKFENVFGFLQDLELRNIIGMEDTNLYHRWLLYQPSNVLVLYLKVWNGEEYVPSSILGFSSRRLIVKGQEQTIGYMGSLWVAEKVRKNQTLKFMLWSIHLDILRKWEIQYCYGLVMVKNEKSFGYIKKSGTIPTEQVLHRVALPFEKCGMSTNQCNVRKVESFSEYEELMMETYRNGYLLKDLKEMFESQYFIGCFIGSAANFQIWKGGKSILTDTQEVLQTYRIFNINECENCSALDFSNLVDQIIHSIPSLEKGQTNHKVLLIFYAFNHSTFIEWLAHTYSNHKNIGQASVSIVYENVSNQLDYCAQEYPQVLQDKNAKVFYDPKDDSSSGQPFVWPKSNLTFDQI